MLESWEEKKNESECVREEDGRRDGEGSVLECAAYRYVSAQRGVLDSVTQVIHGHGVLKLDVRPIFAS